MSTGNVTTYHQDGGINFNDVKPDHVGSKVGTAETGDANRVTSSITHLKPRMILEEGSLWMP